MTTTFFIENKKIAGLLWIICTHTAMYVSGQNIFEYVFLTYL